LAPLNAQDLENDSHWIEATTFLNIFLNADADFFADCKRIFSLNGDLAVELWWTDIRNTLAKYLNATPEVMSQLTQPT
jgi:hypothetical protein